MNVENVEYWVLNSMAEARVSLENGEVPVGCLFLIHSKTLDAMTQENAARTENNGIPDQIKKHLPEITCKKPTATNEMTISGEIVVKSDNYCPSTNDRNLVDRMTEVGVCKNHLSVGTNTLKNSEPENRMTEVGPCKLGVGKNHLSVGTNTLSNNEPADKSGGYVIIARGKNEVNATKNATRHAEMVCIDQIVETYKNTYGEVFEKMTVIVNVEPCIMCMAALLDLHVKSIVFTCVNDRFGYNILGTTERTNYVEIVELHGNACLDRRTSETEYPQGLARKLKCEVEKGLSSGKLFRCDRFTQKPQMNESEGDVRTDGREQTNEHLAKIDSKDETNSKPNCKGEIAESSTSCVQYKLSFMNKSLLLKKDEIVENKMASLVDNYRINLCCVFHYRKYESDTMDILKLFYKGINPNAPKNKVKIKSGFKKIEPSLR